MLVAPPPHTHTSGSYKNLLTDGWIGGVFLSETPAKNLFIFKITSDLSGQQSRVSWRNPRGLRPRAEAETRLTLVMVVGEQGLKFAFFKI